MLGGHKGITFVLQTKVELTEGEQELVRRYKVESYPLTWVTSQGNRVPKDTVASLMAGTVEEVKDITVPLNNEAVIKNACQEFKTLLDVMATFGGQESFEY